MDRSCPADSTLPPERTLYGLFLRSALRHPEVTALEVAGESVRYRELLDLVDRLASHLVRTAGHPPAVVALQTSRTLAAYAGYLASLRLGATVVPLSPGSPVARNAWICERAHAAVVLLDQRVEGGSQAPALTARTGAAAVALRSGGRRPWYWSLDTPPWPEPCPARPQDTAYILFTSGSTGVPKGVPVKHYQVTHYLLSCTDGYEVRPGCRVVQAFDLTFDPSVFTMHLAWRSGGTLVVPEPQELLAPPDLVARRQITHWCSVPSVISIARRDGELLSGSMPGLRWSMFGGEPLTLDAARAWADAAPGSVIENLYGPTELAICCASYRLPASQAQWPETANGTVPIGPIHPHLESVVVTSDGQAGSMGELCVRGPQRFDGYLDEAHNRGAFLHFDGYRAVPYDRPVPSPEAWYRTGDRVETGLDGVMVHLGRVDQQVKIRGYRVELGEIESVLRLHPRIRDAVALADPAGSPMLYACYTGERVDPAELSALAEEQLPAHMRPERYHWLETVPLNVNGKVDRARLRSELHPGQARGDRASANLARRDLASTSPALRDRAPHVSPAGTDLSRSETPPPASAA